MKKTEINIKLQIKACEANPSPPVGPALGSKGINIMQFCNEFNEQTKNMTNIKKGTLLPTVISIRSDKSFKFIIKSPPASILIKNILNLKKGSNFPNKNKVGNITKTQLTTVINQKKNDLIVNSQEAALNTLIGTAKSMGVNISGT